MITNSQEYLSSRVRSLESIINELHFKIQELHQEIIQIIRTSPTTQPSSSISQKEAKMKNLKNQLQDLERQHKQIRITSLIDDPWRLPSTPFASEQRRLKPSTKKEPTFSQESQSIADVVASTKTPDVLPIQKVNPVSMFLNSLHQEELEQAHYTTYPSKFEMPIPVPHPNRKSYSSESRYHSRHTWFTLMIFSMFSPDEQSHAELLLKFYSLVAKYGIMLSEKKMEVGVTTIQFLGTKISNGKYQPQPHVAQELLKFQDELSSQKMIQQFLGLVNYMAAFLPKLSHHTALLFPMLKKNAPQWASRQTEAVKAIKCLVEKMPPLKIPTSLEKRILQTDASDKCWGAVLLVQDNNNKRHICGYKSGTFKAFEQHYHSTFKEILAVKRSIEKF
ncbi:putative reverse transcriptase domain, viral movement protein [Tanacetum coccineum]